MDMDLDFDDMLNEADGGNVRPQAAKFQPKAKPRPKKNVKFSLPVVPKEKSDTTSTVPKDALQNISPIDAPIIMSSTSATTFIDPSPKLVENQELLTSTDSDNMFASVDISPRSFMANDVDSAADILLPEDTNCNMNEDLQAINNLLSSCPVNNNAEGSSSHAEGPVLIDYNTNDLEIEPSISSLSSVGLSTFKPCSYSAHDNSQEFLESRNPINLNDGGASDYGVDFLIDKRSEREEAEVFPSLESLDFTFETTTTAGDNDFFPIGSEYPETGLASASPRVDIHDLSVSRLSDSAAIDESQLPIIELTDCANASGSGTAMSLQAEESQDIPAMPGKERGKKKSLPVSKDTGGKLHVGNVDELSQGTLSDRSVLAEDEGNGAGKSSRQQRKRSAAPIVDDRIEDGITEDGNRTGQPSYYSLVDEDDDEDENSNEYQEEASSRKRAPRKTMAKPKNDKRVRRCKKSSDEPVTSSKELSKKKFSHSTRRNKRQVSKVLLETPEEEINPQQLIIKDLILLAEARERIQKQKAIAPKNAATSENATASNHNGSVNYFSNNQYRHDHSFALAQGENVDDEQMVQPDSPIHNYHTYMDKTPRGRWSKQDTELFYEAIRQFGTNFEMIQQLFPDRTRNQIKFKYKKEERQNPSMLSDALTNRSKSHSHFELVIEKLRQTAGDGEEEYDQEWGPVGVSGEADVVPENVEVDNTDGKEEELNDNIEQEEITEAHGPVNSSGIEDDGNKCNEDEDEDDFVIEYDGY